MQPGQRISSFTLKYNGRVNKLVTEAEVGPAFDPATEQPPILKKYKALWDTGAANSAITKRVVDECGLKPISMAIVDTASGRTQCPVHLVCIGLPNRVGFNAVNVTELPICDADMLIGMDLICEGDFAVTTSDGKTTFTYRHPSIACLDFVQESNEAKSRSIGPTPPVGRNDPCPCGSGKKYKNCCMRKH